MAGNLPEKRALNLFEMVRQNKRQRTVRNTYGIKIDEAIDTNNFTNMSDAKQFGNNSSGLNTYSNIQNSFTSKIITYNINKNYTAPYYGWTLYFFDEVFEENSDTAKRIEICESFFKRNESLILDKNFRNLSVDVDLGLLYNDKFFQNHWSSFDTELKCYPERTLKYLGLALHQTIVKKDGKCQCPQNILTAFPKINVKVKNDGPILHLRELNYNKHGNLVSVIGCVTQISSCRVALESQVIICKKCSIELLVIHPTGINSGGRALKPPICNICGRREYRQLSRSPYAENPFVQTIKLHEEVSCTEMQRTIRVELREDLVNCCLPGDVVTVTGIYKINENLLPNETISAMNVTNKSVDYNMNLIEDIKNTPNLLKVLVQSLCPEPPGQDIIKAILLLGLFNGSEDSDRINILIVTDAGCGTVQLLESCFRVAHKGIHINGKQCSPSGLESVFKKMENGINSSLEAGAASIAGNGCCCINDLQKISNHSQVLTNLMRRDEEDLIDTNFKCNIPAKPSVFASIRPIGGIYDKSKRLDENIQCHRTLLHNFDLIFVISNEPDEVYDKLIIDHKINSHRNVNGSFTCSSDLSAKDFQLNNLQQQITRTPYEYIDTVPHSLLKMYISYARQHVKPELTESAKRVLLKYLSKLECDLKEADNLLTALIKLTQARAKTELRSIATENDVHDALSIYEYSKNSSTNAMCSKQVIYGKDNGKITKQKVNAFLNSLKDKVVELNKDIISYNELQNIAIENHIVDFTTFICKLNEEGYLLKYSPKTYKVVRNYM